MDSVLSCRAGIQHFLSPQPKLDQTGYEVTLHLLGSTTHTRAKVCAAAILRKLHLLEVLEKLRDDVMNLQSVLPPPANNIIAPQAMEVDEPTDDVRTANDGTFS